MYERYWELKEKPFENLPDPKYLYHSRQHDEALMRLLYAIQSGKGAAMLTGEYGCGKTLLMHTILSELSSERFETAYLTNPIWSAIELIQEIVYQLGIEVKSNSRIELLHTLNDFLYETARNNRSTLIVIDEAQAITDRQIFEELRLLLNFQLNDRFLITLFLVGQPELREVMKDNHQLKQRISISYHLKRFSYEETREYITYRLSVAGRNDPIFTDEAYQEIFNYSNGTPRMINNICDLALVIGFGRKVSKIDGNLIKDSASLWGV